MNNEPAFPTEQYATTDMVGMSLRDYFAAKAMQSYMLITQKQHPHPDGNGFVVRI